VKISAYNHRPRPPVCDLLDRHSQNLTATLRSVAGSRPIELGGVLVGFIADSRSIDLGTSRSNSPNR